MILREIIGFILLDGILVNTFAIRESDIKLMVVENTSGRFKIHLHVINTSSRR